MDKGSIVDRIKEGIRRKKRKRPYLWQNVHLKEQLKDIIMHFFCQSGIQEYKKYKKGK